MVYLRIGNEYVDGCFNHLQVFLRILDSELSEIDLRIKKSKDPDSEGLCDLGEYLIGYGFVAIQRYMASTYTQTNISKGDIYKHGLKLCEDLFLIEVINAGANYWKHEPEWPFVLERGDTDPTEMTPISIDRTGAKLSKFEKNTFDVISKLTPYADYTLSNLLSEIINRVSPDTPLSFKAVLPFIEQWRNELDNYGR
ncbi:MAG: hypothetical protein ACLFR0_01030 [Alphaproteobacteria bacterium]